MEQEIQHAPKIGDGLGVGVVRINARKRPQNLVTRPPFEEAKEIEPPLMQQNAAP